MTTDELNDAYEAHCEKAATCMAAFDVEREHMAIYTITPIPLTQAAIHAQLAQAAATMLIARKES